MASAGKGSSSPAMSGVYEFSDFARSYAEAEQRVPGAGDPSPTYTFWIGSMIGVFSVLIVGAAAWKIAIPVAMSGGIAFILSLEQSRRKRRVLELARWIDAERRRVTASSQEL
jgi:hypothetical protein